MYKITASQAKGPFENEMPVSYGQHAHDATPPMTTDADNHVKELPNTTPSSHGPR